MLTATGSGAASSACATARISRNSRAVRSAHSSAASCSFRAAPGSRSGAHIRINRSVCSKFSPHPNCSAAARRARLRIAGASPRNRSSSSPTLPSPGLVETARPPPRTARPGNTRDGSTLANSASHQLSSSRAIVARCASCSAMRGLNSASCGNNRCRIRFRVWAVSWFDASSRHACPICPSHNRISARLACRIGRRITPRPLTTTG